MSTPLSLPSVPGLAWSRHKMPKFNTRVASHVSGREVRLALYVNPLYEFEATYSGIFSGTASGALAGLGSSSLQALMGFHEQMQGQFGTFLYTDPDDNTVSAGPVGTGNGTTSTFIIQRTLGGFTEAVSWVTAVTAVYFNGVPTGGWGWQAPNTLGFFTAPPNGVVITADYTFAFQCRFLDDQLDFEEFMSKLYKLDSLKFRSVKANTSAGPWYYGTGLGGVLPALFADFTTEGGGNHYYFNGSTYAGSAALLSAIGGTFTRSTTKYVTGSNGLLTSIASNALPFDYSPTSVGKLRGLLLEGQSENILTYSNTFTNGVWDNQGATLSQTVTSPDGTADAWSMTCNGAGFGGSCYLLAFNVGNTASSPASLSIYAKYVNNQWVQLFFLDNGTYYVASFDIENGVAGVTSSGITSTISSAGNGWYRLSLSRASVVATNNNIGFALSSSNTTTLVPAISSGQACDIFGIQDEVQPVATSLILTTSGGVYRAADSLVIGAGGGLPYTGFSSSAFTGYAAIQLEGNVENYGNQPFEFMLSTNPYNNRFGLYNNNASPGEWGAAAVASSPSESAFPNFGSLSTSATQLAMSLSASQVAAVQDGGTVATATITSVPPVDQVGLGGRPIASASLFGWLAQIGFWSVTATPAQLKAMT